MSEYNLKLTSEDRDEMLARIAEESAPPMPPSDAVTATEMAEHWGIEIRAARRCVKRDQRFEWIGRFGGQDYYRWKGNE